MLLRRILLLLAASLAAPIALAQTAPGPASINGEHVYWGLGGFELDHIERPPEN